MEKWGTEKKKRTLNMCIKQITIQKEIENGEKNLARQQKKTERNIDDVGRSSRIPPSEPNKHQVLAYADNRPGAKNKTYRSSRGEKQTKAMFHEYTDWNYDETFENPYKDN